jgi:hypothetical protein
MSNNDGPLIRESFLRDFLLKDYELKVQTLTSHLQRSLMRSNFFLTIEAGLFALSLNERYDRYVLLFIIAGWVVSILWYCFAVLDNYWVELFRGQIGQTYHLLCSQFHLSEGNLETHSYIGEAPSAEKADATIRTLRGDEEANSLLWQIFHWPPRRFGLNLGPTELSAILSAAFLLLWVLRAIAAA